MYVLLELQDNGESGNVPQGISTSTMITIIIIVSATVGLLLITVFCTVNYSYFHYHSKSRSGAVYPMIPGNGESQATLQSRLYLESSHSRPSRNNSSYPKMIPQITTQGSSKVDQNQNQLNPTPVKAVSPSTFMNSNYLSQKSILKQSSVSLEANAGSLETPMESSVEEVPKPSTVTMNTFSNLSEIVHTSDNYDIQERHEYTGRSDASILMPLNANVLEEVGMESSTAFSSSLADAILSSKESALGGVIQHSDQQLVGGEQGIEGCTGRDAEKKQSALFEVKGLPSELTVTPVKLYFSSGAVPGKPMEIVS